MTLDPVRIILQEHGVRREMALASLVIEDLQRAEVQHAFWNEGGNPELDERRVLGIDAVVAGAKVAHARGDVVVLIDGEGVETGSYCGTQNRQEKDHKHQERDIEA